MECNNKCVFLPFLILGRFVELDQKVMLVIWNIAEYFGAMRLGILHIVNIIFKYYKDTSIDKIMYHII